VEQALLLISLMALTPGTAVKTRGAGRSTVLSKENLATNQRICQLSQEQGNGRRPFYPAFLRMPAEIRHEIYRLVLTTSEPIIDPCVCSPAGNIIQSPFRKVPRLGIALLSTCRQIYSENLELGFIYRDNIFQFTTASHAHDFFTFLGKQRASLVRMLAIDLRLVAAENATAADAWLSYASERSCEDMRIPSRIRGLRTDVPRLRCVRLELQGWCRIGLESHRWEYFQSILRGLQGLDCISMGGEVRTRSLDLAMCEPWAPELLLTHAIIDRTGNKLSGSTMVDIMAQVVLRADARRTNKDLVLSWSIMNGRVVLEVSTKARTARALSAVPVTSIEIPWSSAYYQRRGNVTSVCNWAEYESQVNSYKPESLPDMMLPPEIIAFGMNGYLSEMIKGDFFHG
jgi:hypothetical protein